MCSRTLAAVSDLSGSILGRYHREDEAHEAIGDEAATRRRRRRRRRRSFAVLGRRCARSLSPPPPCPLASCRLFSTCHLCQVYHLYPCLLCSTLVKSGPHCVHAAEQSFHTRTFKDSGLRAGGSAQELRRNMQDVAIRNIKSARASVLQCIGGEFKPISPTRLSPSQVNVDADSQVAGALYTNHDMPLAITRSVIASPRNPGRAHAWIV